MAGRLARHDGPFGRNEERLEPLKNAEKRYIRSLLDLDLVYTWIILVGSNDGFLVMNIFYE